MAPPCYLKTARKPACSKWWSAVKASDSPRSAIIPNEMQSVKDQALSGRVANRSKPAWYTVGTYPTTSNRGSARTYLRRWSPHWCPQAVVVMLLGQISRQTENGHQASLRHRIVFGP